MEATLAGTPGTLAAGGQCVTKADMRVQPRLLARGLVTIIWRDKKGQIRNMRSLLQNFTGGGALVLSYRPLPVGAFVRIRDTNLFFLAGCARVRHCNGGRFAYLIGLKFDSAMATRF
ncbi:MAG: hypothetical protein JWO48_2237 [Bryobacterales bacterium]|nr:hypothetical protein [Bryobacterales bacterium]